MDINPFILRHTAVIDGTITLVFRHLTATERKLIDAELAKRRAEVKPIIEAAQARMRDTPEGTFPTDGAREMIAAAEAASEKFDAWFNPWAESLLFEHLESATVEGAELGENWREQIRESGLLLPGGKDPEEDTGLLLWTSFRAAGAAVAEAA